MEENFYTLSQLPVITPGNCEQWLAAVSKCDIKPVFQEIMSGSGRLSARARSIDAAVAFPADFRYGWDINLVEHQRRMETVRDTLDVSIMYYSPKSTPWTRSTKKPSDTRNKAQQDEMPSLVWISQLCTRTLREEAHRGFIIEQNASSTMFADSPVSELAVHPDVQCGIAEQC